jgi:16S rRNA (cytosine967-C5)-methyltransferase
VRIQGALQGDRRFGSRDRRLYRELLFTTVRFLPWIEPLLDSLPERAAERVAWLAAETPDTAAFRSEMAGTLPPLPESLEERAALLTVDVDVLVPDWLGRECPAARAPAEMDALHRRARLWIRLQDGDPEKVSAELGAAGVTLHPSGVLRDAVEAKGTGTSSDADLTRSLPFQRGAFEIQDLGSQIVIASQEVKSGERWLDACAGAGGKTLQLAALVGPDGSVAAYDPRGRALDELQARVARAALGNVRVLREPPRATPRSELYDAVLVDAPCSGSGTWRRAPHLKWTTTTADLQRQAERQRELLAAFAASVRPGGRLVYATCSLARSENEEVAAAFLAAHPRFEPTPATRDFGYDSADPGLSILPARHDTDGFYVAAFRKASD